MSQASLPPRSCCQAIHFPSDDHTSENWRSSDTASCSGQPPLDATFHRFIRPVRFVVKTISRPSGDHAGLVMLRLKKRSSTGTGLASAFRAEVMLAGSVIVRSSGERANTNTSEDAATRIVMVRMRANHIVHLHGYRASLTGRKASGK